MLTWEFSALTVWVIMKLRVHTTCQNWLACQSVSGIHCFCQTKTAAYEYTGCPSRTRSVWSSPLELAELKRHICELANLASQFWQMINNLRWHVSRDEPHIWWIWVQGQNEIPVHVWVNSTYCTYNLSFLYT